MHFLYYVSYIIFQLPFYINVFYLGFGDDDDREKKIIFKISIVMHLSLGLVMNLIRAYETNFYYHVFFCFKKKEFNKKLTSLSTDENVMENKKHDGEIIQGFLDPDQPLTVMINKTLNHEFTCCILFGLSTIYHKSIIKNQKNLEKSTKIYLINSSSRIKKSTLNSSSEDKEITKYIKLI